VHEDSVRLVFGLIEVNVRHLSGSLRPKLLWLVQPPPVDLSELGPNAPDPHHGMAEARKLA